ncbi:MAG TPA: hypothetical protein VGK38_10800 [Prolixibacteraceae bacterium]|jgi:hypothetical protein
MEQIDLPRFCNWQNQIPGLPVFIKLRSFGWILATSHYEYSLVENPLLLL